MKNILLSLVTIAIFVMYYKMWVFNSNNSNNNNNNNNNNQNMHFIYPFSPYMFIYLNVLLF